MKSCFINILLQDVKAKALESRLISSEILSLVDHPEFPRPGPQENAALFGDASRLKLFKGAALH